MSETSTNVPFLDALDIPELPSDEETDGKGEAVKSKTYTEEEAASELDGVLEGLQYVIDDDDADELTIQRAKFVKRLTESHFSNIKSALEYDLFDDLLDDLWDQYDKMESGEGFEQRGFKLESEKDLTQETAPEDIPYERDVDMKKVRKLGIKGVKYPIRRSTVKRILELAGRIDDLKQRLLNEGKMIAAQQEFWQYWSEIQEIASEAAQQSNDEQVREFYTMSRGGFIKAILQAKKDLKVSLCNEEIASWLTNFCKDNKFDYI